MAAPSRAGARARRRRTGRAGRPVWLFDLDDTLHGASHAIFPDIERAMTAYIVRQAGLDSAAADALRRAYGRRYGATLLGLIRHHGIDARAFLREVHDFADLASMVRAERGLRRILRALPGRKIVITNGPRFYARAVLAVLGIADLFEGVIGIDQMRVGGVWRAKPSAVMLRATMRRMGVRLADAILVEDTRGHLKRYRRLHLATVWMTGHAAPAGSGRPHYVDHRVRTLRALRGLSSARRRR